MDLEEPDLESSYLQPMSEARAVYIHDKNGRVGRSGSEEIRIAEMCGQPMFALEPITEAYFDDEHFRKVIAAIPVMSPDDFLHMMVHRRADKIDHRGQFWFVPEKKAGTFTRFWVYRRYRSASNVFRFPRR